MNNVKISDIIDVLSLLLTTQQQAELLNALLSCESNPILNDEQAAIGEALFADACVAFGDEVIEMAQKL